MEFMLYHNGQGGGRLWSLDEMFQYRVRFHVLVQTQDELDQLEGYMLVYGRKLEVSLYKDWQRSHRASQYKVKHGLLKKPIALPPLVFSTVFTDSDQYGI